MQTRIESHAAKCGATIAYLVALTCSWGFAADGVSPGNILGIYSIRKFALLLAESYAFAWLLYLSTGPGCLRQKWAACGLSTGAILATITMLEIPAVLGLLDYRLLLRPSDRVLTAKIRAWEQPGMRYDDELIHIRRPYYELHTKTTGNIMSWLNIPTDRQYRLDLRYDSRGFRNDHEIDYAPVVVIGDSFAEAALVAREQVLASELSRSLGTEVAGLGQSGYGPQQEFAVLRRYGVQLNPKLVIWLFFEGNDLLDVQSYERFLLDRAASSLGPPQFWERSFVKNGLLVLAELTGPSADETTPRYDEARRRSCRFLRARTEEEQAVYFVYGNPYPPGSDEQRKLLRTSESIILEARQTSSAAGAQFLLVYVPFKFRVYQDFCEFPEDGYGREWQPNDLPALVQGWADDQGITFLDLTPALRAAAADGELVFFTEDMHWNARGNEVAARAILKLIEEKGWLRCAACAEFTVSPED